MVYAFDRRKQDLLIESDNGSHKSDPATAELVQLVLSHLLMSTLPTQVESETVGSEEMTFCKQPYAALRQQNIVSFLESVFDIFSESFADTAACTALNVHLEDYILMHVFEDWDLNESLQNSTSNVYRISAVLSVCFPEQLTQTQDGPVLCEEAKLELTAAIEKLVKHGMPKDRLNVNELCENINNLMKKWPEVSNVIDKLVHHKTNNWLNSIFCAILDIRKRGIRYGKCKSDYSN